MTLLPAGVAFLTLIGLLIGLSIAIYQKVFDDVTTITIKADRAGLLDFYQRYGFRSWRKELEESLGAAPAAVPPASNAVSLRWDMVKAAHLHRQRDRPRPSRCVGSRKK